MGFSILTESTIKEKNSRLAEFNDLKGHLEMVSGEFLNLKFIVNMLFIDVIICSTELLQNRLILEV